MPFEGSPRGLDRDDGGTAGSPRQTYPTTPATRRGLQFSSPPLSSSRSVPYLSPERHSAVRMSSVASASARLGRVKPLNGLVTPASSLSTRIRSLDSPAKDHNGDLTASASQINRLFSEQKDLNESKLTHRIRELEEEKNRIIGENEVLNYEMSKARQAEGRLKREIDEMKERIISLKRDLEVLRRDEEAKRRTLNHSLEETRREFNSIESERSRLVKDLEATQKMVKCVEQELEEEKSRTSTQIDILVKKAIEKERKQWEKEQALRVAAHQDDNDELRKKSFEMETLALRRQGEIDELRKQLEKLKNESERERHALLNETSTMSDRLEHETQGLRLALEKSESERKYLEAAFNDSKLAELSLQKQLDEEKARAEQRIALACKRAIEKEQEERRVRGEAAAREDARRRQELENAIDETRQMLAKALEEKETTTKSLEDARMLIGQLQQELDSQHELEAQRVDLACRRAVDRERASWDKLISQQKATSDRELQEAKSSIAKLETYSAKLERDLQESKRASERLRFEFEKELASLQLQLDNCDREHEIRKRSLQSEVDGLVLKLAASEDARRKAERETNEVRRLLDAVEVEREADMERFNAKLETSIRRAIEKDRAEQRLRIEAKEREDDQQRLSLKRELEDLQAVLDSSRAAEESSMEELERTRDELRRLRSEFDREKESWQDDQDVLMKRMEREKRALLGDKQHLEQHIGELERSQAVLLEERAALLDLQEQSQAEISNLQNRLAQATTREERLLLDLSDMRGRSVQQQLLLRTGTESRRPLTENLPPPVSYPKRVSAQPTFPRSTSLLTPAISTSSLLKPSFDNLRQSSTLRTTPNLTRRVAHAKRLLESEF